MLSVPSASKWLFAYNCLNSRYIFQCIYSNCYLRMFSVCAMCFEHALIFTLYMGRPGHLPEAGFRRHAPRQRKRRWWWRWRGGAMWLLRTAVSSLGTYISLIGQSSMSALLSPSTGPSRTVTTSCAMCEGMQPRVKPNADFSLLSATLALALTILYSLWLFFQGLLYVQHSGCDSHRQPDFTEGNKQAQRFSKQAGSLNYTKSLWCSYNLDIMCYIPGSDIPQFPAR